MKKIIYLIIAAVALSFYACNDCSNAELKSDKIADSVKNVTQTTNYSDIDEQQQGDSTNIQNEDPLSNDDNFVSEHQEVQNVATSNDFKLDEKGIGNVKIGMNINDLMKKQNGLYDKTKITKSNPDKNICLLYNKNVQVMEVVYGKKDNIVKSIRITAPSIKTKDGIYQGLNVKAIKKSKSLKKFIAASDIDNADFIVINGIRYEFDENIKGDKFVSAIIIQ